MKTRSRFAMWWPVCLMLLPCGTSWAVPGADDHANLPMRGIVAVTLVLNWLAQTFEALRASGCTVLMSTHAQSVAMRLATRAVLLDRGALVQDTGPGGDARALLAESGVAGERR